jgi:hypothetical protein
MNKPAALGLLVVLLLAAAAGVEWWSPQSSVAQVDAALTSNTVIEVYKSPQCGCCGAWVSHLRTQGFRVKVHEVLDTTTVREMHRVPAALGSCHTATVSGYTIEGHVPAADIQRLLKDKPAVAGLAVPGMPAGSPGMESASPQAFQTLAFSKEGDTQVFSEHPAAATP